MKIPSIALYIIGLYVLISSLSAQQKGFKQPSVMFEIPLSDRIANYDIEVKLEPSQNLLHGHQILIWRNTSQSTISELQFHLYLNAFRNNRSTFMIESRYAQRGFAVDSKRWGFIDINRIKRLNSSDWHRAGNIPLLPSAAGENNIAGKDLTNEMQFIHPDNKDHIHDKTVVRLPLTKPLLPQQTIVLYFNFTAKLPEPPFARSGAKEEYFFMGQWFPKIGVHKDGDWNCHQFHYNSEFFADFGVYNVWITVPDENVVGATGIEIEIKENDNGTSTHYYHAEDVHDFVWSTSPKFIEFKGKTQDVDIRLLMQPDHVDQAARHMEATKTAIEYCQNWYGDYPFPNLTVVDPRRGAKSTGGMEYPTLFTSITTYGLPDGLRLVESAIIHEFVHNYWYHMLASNEFEESWLDEGITTYSEIQIMNHKYGPSGDLVNFFGIKLNVREMHRGEYILFPAPDPVLQNAWDFYSESSYAVNSYAKSALFLVTLENYLGRETMQEILRTYFQRWKFKHPRTQDFVNTVNDVSGQNLTSFFDQALHTTAILDYSVDKVFTRRYREERGFDFDFQAGTEDSVVTSLDSLIGNQAALDTPAESTRVSEIDSTSEQTSKPLYYSGVNIRRLGDFRFPVELEVVFDNGEIIREDWDGQDLWKKFRYLKPVKLASATIDPDRKIVMDVNFTNNSKSIEAHSKGINKLTTRFLFWCQFIMDQPEILSLLSLFQ